MGRKSKDMTGMKFGRLTVIERAENDKHGNVIWICQCECGNITKVRGISLRTVKNCIASGEPLNGRNAKYDKKYIGSYIIKADEFDSKHN